MTSKPSPPGSSDSVANVFVSYSRKDVAFVDRLEESLTARGFSPMIDRQEIYAFEDWWKRIEELIVKADTIVFVLSPDAVSSEICSKEIKFAASLKKRLAPIVCRPLGAASVPDELARLNFILFDDEARFDERADELARGVSTNIDWVRKHTEFGALARRWSQASQRVAKGLLLRSPVLEEAEKWIASRPHNAPQPTEATQTFVAESRRAESRRRNILIFGLSTGLMVALVLAGLALWQRGVAVENEEIATRQARIATENETRALVALSNLASERGEPVDAVRFALAAWPRKGDERPQMRRAITALSSALPLQHERLRLEGHGGKVRAAAFSPDGERAVTGSDDNIARIWDARTGVVLKELKGHNGPITSVAFSPDGERVITGSLDETHRIWNTSTGAVLIELKGPFLAQGASAAFSPDGIRVAITSLDGARIYDSRTGAVLKELRGHGDAGDSVSFSPDGTRILTASLDRTARIWDARTGAVLKELKGHGDAVYSALFSSDGARVITACEDDIARIFDVNTGAVLKKLQGSGVFAAFSPDGTRVITASSDKIVRIWDAKTGTVLKELKGHTGAVGIAAFSPNGERVITSSDDKTARLWDARTPSVLKELNGGKVGQGIHAALSPDGARLVTASDFGTARIWDARTGAVLKELKVDGNVLSLAFSPNGAQFVIASSDMTARLWDVSTGKVLTVLKGHRGAVTSAAFSPDGTRLVTASMDNTVRIWDPQTGAVVKELKGHGDGVASTAFSPDRHGVNAAAFSPEGARLVIASDDKTARILDARTGAILEELKGHGDAFTSAAFSPDGARIVTASLTDDIARIWDARTSAVLAELKGRGDGDVGSDASFSPDGAKSSRTPQAATLASGMPRRAWP